MPLEFFCILGTEVVRQQYGVTVGTETIRRFLRRTGFGWRRTRYGAAKRPDPHEYADAQHDLAWLKRGLCSTCGSYGMCTKQNVALAAEPTSTACAVKQPVCVPKRPGKPSRVNVMGR